MQSEKDVSNASDPKRSRCCWYPGRNNEFRAARLKRALIGDMKRSFALNWPSTCFEIILVAGAFYAFSLSGPEAAPKLVQPQRGTAAETAIDVKPVSRQDAR